ncbi:MAG TPA: bifunctional UDP-N-acetylglucosamine diphosphorylase/glucosamine-1-phosphate N-acetyltransferase GlmU [Candidatus Anaerobiospirillum pullistercoris]|uniref:Bifunctional protein GlmU n=1 Tax=Candidatus Anaerobiospirillum pullistercoris TaxID=2838452 RepID=A0A9D1WG96_9GAMM|nr:bifunctional UDP-N-acetylglucosamine diphosphorylase/glucosamine-1-phosphate N-acetyltransferase GlmU [Candidatus Anaerobiospirillum pullistercoris]
MSLEVIVLAAGLGKRMHSDLPKVLHQVARQPMLFHVLRTANSLNPSKIHVVLGHQSQLVAEAIEQSLEPELRSKLTLCIQSQQLGTAHAVQQALPNVDPHSQVIVLYGDTPLTPKADLENLLEALKANSMSLLTAVVDNPFGYGRIIRNDLDRIACIVEEKDATPEQKAIKEINTGMIATTGELLQEFIPQIQNQNAQQEYYLTDLAGLLVQAGRAVGLVHATAPELLAGVNNKLQLSQVERIYQEQQANRLMMDGLTLADPKRFDLRGELTFGKDCFIDTNVIIEGKVVLGDHVSIGTGCVLKDVTIGDRSEISPYTVMEKSELKRHTTIGPFARLRPGNVLEDEVHIGNFVEVKNSHIEEGTKSGHLTYIGDSDIGAGTNIGAGTITCNYDGANKHRTTIGKNVFIGSDTQLVAPVTVEDGATVGAGATVTRTVPANALFVTRAQPRILPGYQRPTKKKK